MKRTESLKKEVTETVDVFCNKCGFSCKDPNGQFCGLIEAEVSGGYGSTHLGDGDVYIFSLCERCLLEMFEKFHYPAKQGNYLHPDNYNPDFDRRKYWGDGVKFWSDLTIEEQVAWREAITENSVLDNLGEVPREELIVWLYDLENKPEPNEEGDTKTAEAIRKHLEQRDTKNP